MKQPSLVDKLVCPKCGKNNFCQSQFEGEFNCWCQRIKLSDDDRVKIKSLGFSSECLCQQCIDLLCKD